MRKFGMILLLGFSLSFAVNAQEVTSKSNMAGLNHLLKPTLNFFLIVKTVLVESNYSLLRKAEKERMWKHFSALLSSSFLKRKFRKISRTYRTGIF
ncbi:MAG: hypothetical protein IPI12_03540 [Ignavibacteriales bacterium]|nr:hypothetical protein [Ignavibacteriales bacterium]